MALRNTTTTSTYSDAASSPLSRFPSQQGRRERSLGAPPREVRPELPFEPAQAACRQRLYHWSMPMPVANPIGAGQRAARTEAPSAEEQQPVALRAPQPRPDTPRGPAGGAHSSASVELGFSALSMPLRRGQVRSRGSNQQEQYNCMVCDSQ